MLQKIFYAIPVKDLRILIVSWTIPDMLEFYASNVSRVLESNLQNKKTCDFQHLHTVPYI